MRQPKVVVGIDGSRTAELALRWAAAAASRRNSALLIAHARDPWPAAIGSSDTEEFARSLLIDAQATVLEGDATCNIAAVSGEENPLQLLTKLSEDADLVVVGSHGVGRGAGIVLGSVAFRVAGHARCPVAIIPNDWNDADEEDCPVVVGVSSSGSSASSSLDFGFAEAAARHVPLRVVHSWSHVDWSADSAELLYKSGSTFKQRQQEYLETTLQPLRVSYPEVDVTAVMVADRVDPALLQAAQRASLMVLGCRFQDGHHYSRLGPTTSRLVHSAPCPVVVVGRSPRTTAANAVASAGRGERAGAGS
jgi:nucleotide-binding universal stress UspA family protein